MLQFVGKQEVCRFRELFHCLTYLCVTCLWILCIKFTEARICKLSAQGFESYHWSTDNNAIN